MKPHRDKQLLDRLFPALREYQALAAAHGISDIFQDNGGKLLQLLIELDLTVVSGRAGSDARDRTGQEYEIKTMNLSLTSNFSTHHHLNPVILGHFRAIDWLFAFYRGIELAAVYRMKPAQLEGFFSLWERRWHERGGRDLNNPKISANFVCANGELLFGFPPQQGLPRSRRSKDNLPD